MSNRFDRFTDFVLRFLSEHAMPSGKRTQQAAQCDENGKFAAFSNQGEAQPVARLLDSSEDIAEEYSRPTTYHTKRKPMAVTDEGDAAQKTCAYELPDSARDGLGTGASRAQQPSARHDAVTHRSLGDAAITGGTSATSGQNSKVSEREKAGSRKEHSPQGRIPAPKKYFEMLRVDTACETIFDSNRWGDQVCLREGVGICKFCGSIVCQPCVTLEFCPNAPCGQSKHLVIVQ